MGLEATPHPEVWPLWSHMRVQCSRALHNASVSVNIANMICTWICDIKVVICRPRSPLACIIDHPVGPQTANAKTATGSVGNVRLIGYWFYLRVILTFICTTLFTKQRQKWQIYSQLMMHCHLRPPDANAMPLHANLNILGPGHQRLQFHLHVAPCTLFRWHSNHSEKFRSYCFGISHSFVELKPVPK